MVVGTLHNRSRASLEDLTGAAAKHPKCLHRVVFGEVATQREANELPGVVMCMHPLLITRELTAIRKQSIAGAVPAKVGGCG